MLLLDKPAGMTSHDVVDAVRRAFGIRRVGHAGTLDPAATGLLLVLIGQATKHAGSLIGASKSYHVVMRCGIRTDTGDLEGVVVERCAAVPPPTGEEVAAALRALTGPQQQTPPMFSAVRVGGRRLYEWARRGVAVPRASRAIVVHTLRLLEFRWPELMLEVDCSKGTYIRTLCEAIGRRLGYPATVVSLRRTRCGTFSVAAAIPWELFLRSSADALTAWVHHLGEDPAWARCSSSAAA